MDLVRIHFSIEYGGTKKSNNDKAARNQSIDPADPRGNGVLYLPWRNARFDRHRSGKREYYVSVPE